MSASVPVGPRAVIVDVRQTTDAGRPHKRSIALYERHAAAAGGEVGFRQAIATVEVKTRRFRFEPHAQGTAVETMGDGAFAGGPFEVVDGPPRQDGCENQVAPVRNGNGDWRPALGGEVPHGGAEPPGEVVVEIVELQGSLLCRQRFNGVVHEAKAALRLVAASGVSA